MVKTSASDAGGKDSILVGETRIPHATGCGQKKKKEKLLSMSAWLEREECLQLMWKNPEVFWPSAADDTGTCQYNVFFSPWHRQCTPNITLLSREGKMSWRDVEGKKRQADSSFCDWSSSYQITLFCHSLFTKKPSLSSQFGRFHDFKQPLFWRGCAVSKNTDLNLSY